MAQCANPCRTLTAAILAGGLGTRLRPAVANLPKVLANVGSRPFITRLLDQLAVAEVRRVVLLVGHRAEQVRAALGSTYGPMSLRYSIETAQLGTGARCRLALPHFDDTILLLNGDSYCDVDIPCLVNEHQRRRADLTLTVTECPDTQRFGHVNIAADGTVIDFLEKSATGGPGWINAGIYVLQNALVQEIVPGHACSLERDMAPVWLRTHRVLSHRAGDRFLDIGTPATYAAAPDFFHAEGARHAEP